MSSFRFLHAADLHLGSPFAGLRRSDVDVARAFAAASREAFTGLVDRALAAGVAFAVIAGDVYDREWKDASIGLFFNQQLARLDRAGVPTFVLKGNHDAESVVTRSISLPSGVRQFGSRAPDTMRIDALKVALHGQSFAGRAATENLASAYPAPEPGWFNVGVLHTSCGGHAAHETYAPCSLDDLRLKGYDYWALGHVHEHAVLSNDPWVVYPGNLQGRSVRECGPRGAVIVDVADGRVARVERAIVDRARWAQATVDLVDVSEEAGLLLLVESAARPIVAEAGDRPVALRLTLAGETALHGALAGDPRHVADEAQAALHRVHPDLWLESLKLRTTAPVGGPTRHGLGSLDFAALLDGLDADPDLRQRATALMATVMSRLPAGALATDGAPGDLSILLEEAKALALGRIGA